MDYVIELRKHFHKYPELSGKEVNTSKKIKQELKKLNIECESVGDYGVIGTLKGKSEGKTIVLRADIDALPISESKDNLKSEKSVVSSVANVCHACGHDAHTAMLLASAKKLSSMRNDFNGAILFCFEQGEEDGSGVGPMLEALKEKNVDAVWGIHVYSELESGKISVEEGARMSGVHFFDVIVVGRGGHGSTPHQTIDPINCVIQIASNLYNIIPREISPSDTSVLTIGELNAGNAPNIIPNTANFKGTIRYFDPSVSQKIVDSFYKTVENIANVHNCEAIINMKEPGYPVINNSQISEIAEESVKESIGENFLIKCNPWMASESMGYYLEKYPGVFALLGIANESMGTGAAHHNPAFDIDESSLKNGVEVTVRFALDFLHF